MTCISETLGKRIRFLRNKAKLTQETVASKAKISPSYLIAIEHGEKKPTIYIIEQIANALDVGMSELFDYDPETLENKNDYSASHIKDAVTKMSERDKNAVYEIIKQIKVIFREDE